MTDFETNVREHYNQLTNYLIEHNLQISTMESITSGQIASLITDTAGSSAILKGAFVTYSNLAKIRQGVPEETINTYGVYSPETAQAMAVNAKDSYTADIGIGVTGSMSNVDPNNEDSVAGEVYFAIAYNQHIYDYFITLPLDYSRFLCKMYIAEEIYKALKDLLGC